MTIRHVLLLDGLAEQFATHFRIFAPRPRRENWEITALVGLMIVAATVRLWGLGSWGFEADEKTMALPTMHIVQHGTPYFPTGMFYARAISQLYMMAGSVLLFGQSEWAFRLPSVLCGIALIPIAYVFGRRFLRPVWNMAFTAVVAFAPAFIADSQEARMYIFMVTCLAGYGALVFEWERSGRRGVLLAAVVVMVVGIQFHSLSVFGAFLLLFPGLVRGDAQKLRLGIVAFIVVVIAFVLINHVVESFYPPIAKLPGLPVARSHVVGLRSILLAKPLLYLAVAAAAAILSAFVTRKAAQARLARAAAVVLLLSFGLQLAFFYHLGLLLLVVGLVMARRAGVAMWRLVLLMAVVAMLAAFQFKSLQSADPDSVRRTIGAMVGMPSIWPFLRFGVYSMAASVIVIIGLLRALWIISASRPIGDYWLFFLLAVWTPLWAIGFFSWDVQERYTELALLPLLLCGVAVCQNAVAAMPLAVNILSERAGEIGFALLACVVIVNPIRVWSVVNAGYAIHPDHKGAAEYIKSLHLHPNDILVAEDMLEQTYYLGHIDYWLMGLNNAAPFVRSVNGELRDIYTGARVIGTGQEFEDLINRHDRGDIYVIGSGELQEDGRRYMRSMGIFEVLQPPTFEQVYVGRDGLTKVWKVRGPANATDVSPGYSAEPSSVRGS